jgi:hypothetical protein
MRLNACREAHEQEEHIKKGLAIDRIEEAASMNTEENQHGLMPVNTADPAARLRTIIDTIPVIAWCARPDGSAVALPSICPASFRDRFHTL